MKLAATVRLTKENIDVSTQKIALALRTADPLGKLVEFAEPEDLSTVVIPFVVSMPAFVALLL